MSSIIRRLKLSESRNFTIACIKITKNELFEIFVFNILLSHIVCCRKVLYCNAQNINSNIYISKFYISRIKNGQMEMETLKI